MFVEKKVDTESVSEEVAVKAPGKDGPVLVILRHGCRVDHVEGKSWVEKSDRPWDSPLHPQGYGACHNVGKALQAFLDNRFNPEAKSPNKKHKVAFYSSPTIRCVDTLRRAMKGMGREGDPIQTEHAIVETVCRHWYLAWGAPGADATWGGPAHCSIKTMDIDKIKTMKLDPKVFWPPKELYFNDEQLNSHFEHSDSNKSDFSRVEKGTHEKLYDLEGSYFSKFNLDNDESDEALQKRLLEFCNLVVERHLEKGESVVLCTHGGPLGICLQGLLGLAEAPKVKYTALSVLERQSCGKWHALVFNNDDHVNNQDEDVRY
mmetsp:Transcript_5673/g.10827  ORF Transcript_5673/g.10827 Transcript_5673/m.10827 type:complete len:318 (+) Transcript_5673:13-966(+)